MMRREGFTVIEVVVAAAILGLVLTALVAMTTLTLRYSNVMTARAEQLRDLNDVTGYMADNIRRSAEILIDTSFQTSGGATVDCQIADPTNPYPCFAVIVPEARAGTDIDMYVFLAYRLEPRFELGAQFKVEDTWADFNTYIIREYRQDLCTSPCNTPPTPTPAVDSAVPYLVIDYLTLESPAGGTFQPFSHTSLSAETDQVTLRFRVMRRVLGKVIYGPGNNIYELSVMTRN